MGIRTKQLWFRGGCVFLAVFSAVRAQVPSSTAKRRQPETGISVGSPKVYDDSALNTLLQNAYQSLGKLAPFDQTTLLKGLGATQGNTVDQTAVSAQISSGQAISPQTATVLNAQQPGSVSAGDLLNEETQLSSLIIGLQLLTQGALSDQLEPGTSLPKTRMTLGFPIDIQVPPGNQYRNAVAEVQVSVCAVEATAGQKPSLITILPQAKTYNVASLVSKSSQLGGGAVSQVVNFAGSFLHSRQTYYLVKDQDTIAIQSPFNVPNTECKYLEFGPDGGFRFKTYQPLVFGWQFKPVLGQTVVQDGIRQTFAQLSFKAIQSSLDVAEIEESLSCEDKPVRIRTGWRHFDPQTGRVGAQIGEFKEIETSVAPPYSQPPAAYRLSIEDNGDGSLTVLALGSFKLNTYVRIGSLVLGSTQGVQPASSATTPNPSGGGAAQSPSPSGGTTPANNTPANNPAANNTAATANGSTPAPAASAPSNGGNAPASNAPAASATAGQTTFQIQGTVQMATAPSTPASTNSGGMSATPMTPSGLWTTAQYIKFIAPANAIAQYGANLVNPDGREEAIVKGYPLEPTPTCAARLAEYAQLFARPVIRDIPPDGVDGSIGVPFSFQIPDSYNIPHPKLHTYYRAYPLPDGLRMDLETGLIFGTPTKVDTKEVTLTAENKWGKGSATLTITTSIAPPVLIGPSSASGMVRVPFAYHITSVTSPATYSVFGQPLPPGLQLDKDTGWIGGVPAASGSSIVRLRASNVAGTSDASLTLNIAAGKSIGPVKPAITSPASASAAVNAPFVYRITASGSQNSFAASGLPSGLVVDPNGVISGTPASGTVGTHLVTLTATNSAGTGPPTTVTLNIGKEGAPVITSASSGSGIVGVAYTYKITATKSPTDYDVAGLPPGWTKGAGGVISWMPAAGDTGTRPVVVSAKNAAGTGSLILSLTIAPAPPPAPSISGAAPATGRVGSSFKYQIAASGSPTGYTQAGLPPGLILDAKTGEILGTPLATSSGNVTLTASNSGGTSPNFTLTLSIEAAPEPSEVTLVPFSDTVTEVLLKNVPLLPDDPSAPRYPVVLIGSAVFGLHDHPFAADPANGSIRFFVPTSLLANTPGQEIVWKYLFEQNDQRKVYTIPPQDPDGVSRCAVIPSTIGFSYIDGSKNNHYQLRGQNLEDLKLISPAASTADDGSGSTLFLFHLSSTIAKTASSIILQCGSDAPLSFALPPLPSTGGTGGTGTTTTTASAKPDDNQQVGVGDDTIKLTGSNMGDIVNIVNGSQRLDFETAADGSAVTINAKSLTKIATTLQLKLFLASTNAWTRLDVKVQ